MKNLISVIIPVYNAKDYLKDCIESVLNQTYQNFEIIAINDNSTDESLAILNDLSKKDNRIKVYSFVENQRPAKVRNYGISLANGEYLAFLDADDICNINRFQSQLDFLINNQLDFCGTKWANFGKNIENEEVFIVEKHEELQLMFLYENYIGMSTVFSKKQVFEKYNFNEAFVPMEDYELWTKIILNFKIQNIMIPLVRYRIHESNISKSIDNNRYKKIRTQIHLNYANNIGLNIKEEDLIYLHALIKPDARLSTDELTKTLFFYKNFTPQLKFNNYLNLAVTNEIISRNINYHFNKLKKNNLKFLVYIFKNYHAFFNNLPLKTKLKFVSKSILHI